MSEGQTGSKMSFPPNIVIHKEERALLLSASGPRKSKYIAVNKGSRKKNGIFSVARPLRGVGGLIRAWPLRKKTVF